MVYGGVGSYVTEALARSGVGHLVLVDKDDACVSNINRQLYALHSTIGKPKVDIAKQRILDINPTINIEVLKEFYLPENSNKFDFSRFSYIVDAIDTVTAKISLVMKANEFNIPIISCMGTGNKLNPGLLTISDIYSTCVCPLARVMRKELKQRGVKKLRVVYSTEEAITPNIQIAENGKNVPGSISFVPPVAGFLMASEVVKNLINFSS